MNDDMVVGGLLDSLLKSLIADFAFDPAKIDLEEAKLAVRHACNAVKPAVSAPMNLDDKAIDAVAQAIMDLFDRLKNPPPLIVGDAAFDAQVVAWGAMTHAARKNRAANYIVENGGDPIKMNPILLGFIAQLAWVAAKWLLDRWLNRNKS